MAFARPGHSSGHQDAEEHKAVIAVLVDQGSSNSVLKKIFNHLPRGSEGEVTTGATINPAGMLPKTGSYYTFPGSLTTPPCGRRRDMVCPQTTCDSLAI